jgi:hypothetical protein
MPAYKVLAITEQIANHVRSTLTDPIYGHPVQVSVAGPGDYGPCRSCLRTFEIGERRILFLYNPFSVGEQTSDFAGPVFIHDQPCERYNTPEVFPEDIRHLPVVCKGYDAHNNFVADEIPSGTDVETAISQLLRRPEIAFILVRNIEAKCFILRIERA